MNRIRNWIMNMLACLKEILCEDNIILWISKLCFCVSVRWCFCV